MFVSIDSKPSLVRVIFYGVPQTEAEYDDYFKQLTQAYAQHKKKFKLYFDLRQLGTLKPKYIHRQVKFMKSIEHLTKQCVTDVEIQVSTKVLQNLLRTILFFKKPVVPCRVMRLTKPKKTA
jgi:NCAIR mutase (PurE)-related protein